MIIDVLVFHGWFLLGRETFGNHRTEPSPASHSRDTPALLPRHSPSWEPHLESSMARGGGHGAGRNRALKSGGGWMSGQMDRQVGQTDGRRAGGR